MWQIKGVKQIVNCVTLFRSLALIYSTEKRECECLVAFFSIHSIDFHRGSSEKCVTVEMHQSTLHHRIRAIQLINLNRKKECVRLLRVSTAKCFPIFHRSLQFNENSFSGFVFSALMHVQHIEYPPRDRSQPSECIPFYLEIVISTTFEQQKHLFQFECKQIW